jgi:hypothetical protein
MAALLRAAERRDHPGSAGWRHDRCAGPVPGRPDRPGEARLGAERHLGLPPGLFALLGTGFCGGLTTFSTFGYETLRLLEDGAIGEAGVNVIGSLAIGVLLAWLGFLLAGALLPVRRGRSPR